MDDVRESSVGSKQFDPRCSLPTDTQNPQTDFFPNVDSDSLLVLSACHASYTVNILRYIKGMDHCHILNVESEPHVTIILELKSNMTSCTASSCPFNVCYSLLFVSLKSFTTPSSLATAMIDEDLSKETALAEYGPESYCCLR